MLSCINSLQVYFLRDVAFLRSECDATFSRTCVPTFFVEISGATLRIGGLAMVHHKLLCAPLTPALHLYCSDDERHMRRLARALEALARALPRVAAFRQAAASASGPIAQLQEESVQWPYLLREHFPGAVISQPWGFSRPVYILRHGGVAYVAKFAQVRNGGLAGDWIGVQRAWHGAGSAPEVVRPPGGAVCVE